jgi:hypothetical protein
MCQSDADTDKDNASDTLDNKRESCVWCRQGVSEAEQPEIYTQEQTANGRGHEPCPYSDDEQSPRQQEKCGQKGASDSLD